MGKHKFLTKKDEARKPTIAERLKQNIGFKDNQKTNNKWGRNSASQSEGKLEQATPWLKLKEAFLQQEAELKKQKESHSKEMDSILQSKILKHKQNRMKEKRNEETVWEEFGADNDKDKEGSHSQQGDSFLQSNNQPHEQFRKKEKSNDKTEVFGADNDKEELAEKKKSNKLERKNKRKFHNNPDGMTDQEKNVYKKVITYNTLQATGNSFSAMMQDLRYRGAKGDKLKFVGKKGKRKEKC